MVYDFDVKCVTDVKEKTNASLTQCPQGTVSSVVLSDESRMLDSLCGMKNLIERINPNLLESFCMRSILTLCVENMFSEMRSGSTDMPLQLQFDTQFTRAIKEQLKRQCNTKFNYFTSSDSYYPQVTTSVNYSDLRRTMPPKSNSLSKEQELEMRAWRADYGQSVPQKTVRNMTTKDNPGTLPMSFLCIKSSRRAAS